MTKEELEARMERSHAAVREIRAEWEARAAAGDEVATRYLRECFGDGVTEKIDVPEPVAASATTRTPMTTFLAQSSEREPGEEG